MIFKSARVQNFRSIADVEVPLGPITVLVGPNNSGKSSFLRAMYTLQQPIREGDVRVGQDKMVVTLSCNGLPPLKIGSGNDIPEDYADSLLIAEGSQVGEVGLKMARPGVQSEVALRRPQATEPDNLIYPVLSQRRGQPYQQQQVTAPSARLIQDSDSNLISRVADLRSSGIPESRRFAELCKNVLGEEFSVVPREHGQILGMRLDRDTTIPLENMGAGLSSTLSLLVGMAVADKKIFLVEEPENDLHPTALKKLLDEVIASSAANQFIITTHSSIVLARLASISTTVILEVKAEARREVGRAVPTSSFTQVDSPERRTEVLRSLGYELPDLGLASAWLILEESSAESLIRWLISWFAPELTTAHTVAARGTGRVVSLFNNLREMFLYTHLEHQYRNRAWVLVDGERSGVEAVSRLREDFRTWSEDHFHCWKQSDIEAYYPRRFKEEVDSALAILDNHKRKAAKEELTQRVNKWISENPNQARDEFAESAAEIIAKLAEISAALDRRDL